MSIRGSVTLECDSKDCRAETVLEDLDIEITPERWGLAIEAHASGWVRVADDQFRCPQCTEEAREREDRRQG